MVSRPARHGPRTVERTGMPEVDDLRERVVDLEARLHALAVSRRVLITLLVSSDKRRKIEAARLKGQVEKLRDRNLKYARALAARDIQIHRLRFRLTEQAGVAGLETSSPPDGCASERVGPQPESARVVPAALQPQRDALA